MAAYAEDGFRPAKATTRMPTSSRIVIFTEAFARRSSATRVGSASEVRQRNGNFQQDRHFHRSWRPRLGYYRGGEESKIKDEDEEEDGKDRARARAGSRSRF
jgi:hypothetical protein